MKRFGSSIPGYNKNEVNAFVNNVTAEYESMLNKLKARDQEIMELRQELNRLKNLENTLNRAILIAEESSQNIKKSTFEESNVIIEDAKRNATRIINNALMKSERVENASILLRKQVEAYRRKYRDLLENQLQEIERFDIND